jgi:RNA polymerase sigma-70 factor (ECF subfamily)
MAVITCESTATISIREKQNFEDIAVERQEHEEIFDTPEQHQQKMLVARALDGDSMAFEQIIAQYSTLMMRTACMIVGDRDVAEDAVQDALIQAWQHLSNLREASALRAWLMRIVVNQCITFKRRLTRSTAFLRQSLSEQEIDLAAQVADDHKGRLERNWDLAEAIKRLPEKQRVVIILHYYNGMTLPEMSQTLQTSENTLKKRIQAALTNLRHALRSGNAEDDTFIAPGAERFAMSAA